MNTAVGSITVTLECHGRLHALCGGLEQRLQLTSGESTVNDAVAALAESHPSAGPVLARCACAVGDSLVAGNRALQDGDTVALIPPVSGG